MRFELASLYGLLLVQCIALALLLPALMGWRVSHAARCAQGFVVLQACGWLALWLQAQALLSAPEGLLDGAGLLCLSAALSALWWAIDGWLGQRPGRWVMAAVPPLLLLVLVLALLAPTLSQALPLGMAHLGLGLQMLTLTLALAWPARPALSVIGQTIEPEQMRRWRGVLLACVLSLALVTLVRGGLGSGLAGGRFASVSIEAAADATDLALAVLLIVAMPGCLMAILVAWRGETEVELQRLSLVDPLTGVSSRSAFDRRAREMISMARRFQEPLALVLVNPDGFKRLNEERGHEFGDKALALFGRSLIAQMRLGDLVGRLEGTVFGVLMARTDLAQGPQALDERLRKALDQSAGADLGRPLDFSAGWAQLRSGDRDIEDVLRRAQAALFEAKRCGHGQMLGEAPAL